MVRRRDGAGFTLIELLVVLVIVAVLAKLAWPSYRQAVYVSNRADATVALLNVQLAQERWRVNNATYGTLANLGMSSSSERGKYTIAITANTATGYTATATAAADSEQLNDTGCTTFTLTVSGSSETRTPTSCW
ncbi:MAG: type IV pilin protein [Magnetococcus sp. XQGC-1]